jgi:hypothetical protein
MRKEKALGVLARKCQEQASRSEGMDMDQGWLGSQ